ncbi:hypothetical protein BC937DRAFT_93667 [Endogone sp. FLAS-F59071]|nr:hypothetical protein BC937DRAFT_93667 [Endogone sp. FLAS-F59071]|eukprot:RUS23010.1 hypothetical protein BC937DRAFT_93667 [Endogone sp. FLAS-F59071]
MQQDDGGSPIDPEKAHPLVDVLEHQAAELPDRPFILYPQRVENNLTYNKITFSQFDKITNVLAERYKTQLQLTNGDQLPTRVVGLLAPTDVHSRNSLPVYCNLIGKTAAKTLIVAPEFLEIGQKLEAEAGVKVLPLQDFDLMLNVNSMLGESTKQIREKTSDFGEQYIIIQSSGSTGLPKPVCLRSNFLLKLGGDLWLRPGIVLSVTPLALGIEFSLITSLLTGHTYAIPYCASWPPSVPEILESLEASGATEIMLVPSVIQDIANVLLAKGDYTFGPLRKLDLVRFGGAPLDKKLGDTMSQAGVNLSSFYGSSELGGLMATPTKEQRGPRASWDAMSPFSGIEYRWSPSEVNPLLKELIVLPTSVLNDIDTEPDGSFRTGDLFSESPPGSGLYTYQGRVGNLLMHTNGEKTNPNVMEEKIREHSIIDQVLIVGAGRFCTAALVQLKHSEVFRRTLEESVRDARAAVMSVNEFVPTHSRVLKDIIYILPLNQELPPTDKGTVKRKDAEQQFAGEIERMYQNLLGDKKSEDVAIAQPLGNKHITVEIVQKSLKSMVADVLGKQESSFDNTSVSLFDLGLDSLMSLELLNNLSKTYGDLPRNIIFENSSILNLSKALYTSLKENLVESAAEEDPMHHRDVELLLDKYLSYIDTDALGNRSPPPHNPASSEIVVMTGATGALGNFILKTMLAEPNKISKVYLLLRGQDAKKRLRKSLQDRRLDPAILEDGRVEILQADLADPHLGLSDETYSRMLTEATAVVHEAWKMNFKLRVTDFEKDTIYGLYNLLVLAHGSGGQSKRFHFTSSVGACLNAPLASVPEQVAPRDPSYSLPNGYSQSKFIADHMCARAAEKWCIPVDIYRVGQISGDTRNGVWNRSEYFPMMIAYGAGWIGEFPDKSGDINWIPLDIAAEAICELAFIRQNTREGVAEMHHILNPHSLTWTKLLGMLHETSLQFREVGQREWADHLIADRANPGNKLAAFWEKTMTEGNEKRPVFETEETCKRSKPSMLGYVCSFGRRLGSLIVNSEHRGSSKGNH